jgi:hypothetical protein
MKELLLKALERMDKAKYALLQEAELICDILDTTDLRQELEQLENTPVKDRWAPVNKAVNEAMEYLDSLPDTLTNSQITAECIKAGITDPEDIHWCQNRYTEGQTITSLEESIQYILTQKQQ